MTKVVIFAGGLGTRLKEETVVKPKPMVEIGGRPILWHIMKSYSHYGFNDFVIALGYKGEMIKDFFLNYYNLNNDITVDLSENSVQIHSATIEKWKVTLVDTGISTETGGRLRRLANHISKETFMLTYGDGVSDVDIGKLFAFHKRHGKLATVTAVRPPSRFGEIITRNGRVTSFAEKPQVGAGSINGGFFVVEPKVLKYIDSDHIHFENEPLARLTKEGQLMAFQHNGYWQCMDTLRDNEKLNKLWADSAAPWKAWK